MLRQHNFTSRRVRRMKRRALIRKLRPFILLILASLIIWAVLSVISSKQAPCVSEVRTVEVLVAQQDKRAEALNRFFEEKQSPLASYSVYFIETADKYGLDWTLMPGIAGVESSFGRYMPEGSNNPFGLERGGRLISFATLYSSIDFEASLLSERYKLIANRAIGNIYCPEQSCTQNWGITVTGFSKEILD